MTTDPTAPMGAYAPVLSDWQMAVVEHGGPPPDLPAADLSRVIVGERDADVRYGERLLPADAEPSIFGYCEVYLRRDDGLWFAYHESDGGSSRSRGLPTKDDALAHLTATLARSHAYWRGLVRHVARGDRDEHGRQVIRSEGTHYIVGAEPAKGAGRDGLGFGGHRWHFRLRSGEEIVSHNLWRQGRIPAEYRDLLPDNAEMVPQPVRSLFDLSGIPAASADSPSLGSS